MTSERQFDRQSSAAGRSVFPARHTRNYRRQITKIDFRDGKTGALGAPTNDREFDQGPTPTGDRVSIANISSGSTRSAASRCARPLAFLGLDRRTLGIDKNCPRQKQAFSDLSTRLA
jgi:hypothetical protein